MNFESEVDLYLKQYPCEDAVSAKKAIMLLYSMMTELAQKEGNSPECWYRIQQLQTWSPLRFFWGILAGSESRIIRAAAKGNICEATGEFFYDDDVKRMTFKNIIVTQKLLDDPDFVSYHRELQTYDGLPEAQELWVRAGFGSFGPELRVREL